MILNTLGFIPEVNENHKYALIIYDYCEEKSGLKKIHITETLEQIKKDYNSFYVFADKAHIQIPFPVEIDESGDYKTFDELGSKDF